MTLRALVLLVANAIFAFAADISGAWNFTVEVGGQSGSPAIAFKQSGESLAGTYSGLLGSGIPIAGTVKGADVRFSFQGQAQGEKMTVEYKGALSEDGKSMKGSVAFGSLGEGTFTATRK